MICKVDPYMDEYMKLVGKTVSSVSSQRDICWSEALYTLHFSDGTLATIMADPEGNGSGFLAITEGVK